MYFAGEQLPPSPHRKCFHSYKEYKRYTCQEYKKEKEPVVKSVLDGVINKLPLAASDGRKLVKQIIIELIDNLPVNGEFIIVSLNNYI